MEIAYNKLKELPKPNLKLSKNAKKHFNLMGNYLLDNDLFEVRFVPLLNVYAEAAAQWEIMNNKIIEENSKNYKDLTGYIQKFKSGAMNVSVWVTLRNDAEATIFKISKQFGLDPKSKKELKSDITGQLDLYDQFYNAKSS